MSKLSVLVESFQPRCTGMLFGDTDLIIPELRPAIRATGVHQSYGRRWIGIPQGRCWAPTAALYAILSPARSVAPTIQSLDQLTRDRFSARAIEQRCCRFYPEAFKAS